MRAVAPASRDGCDLGLAVIARALVVNGALGPGDRLAKHGDVGVAPAAEIIAERIGAFSPGAGLGLAISRTIVEAHGGRRLRGSDRPGRGHNPGRSGRGPRLRRRSPGGRPRDARRLYRRQDRFGFRRQHRRRADAPATPRHDRQWTSVFAHGSILPDQLAPTFFGARGCALSVSYSMRSA
ncbi:hypothetical protein B4Q13_18465 [Lacticaseibacillus rhamnosus]